MPTRPASFAGFGTNPKRILGIFRITSEGKGRGGGGGGGGGEGGGGRILPVDKAADRGNGGCPRRRRHGGEGRRTRRGGTGGREDAHGGFRRPAIVTRLGDRECAEGRFSHRDSRGTASPTVSPTRSSQRPTQPSPWDRRDEKISPTCRFSPSTLRTRVTTTTPCFAEPDPDRTIPPPPGGHVLWVAIADVAHYVTPDSALDREARLRGNSTYFPDRVVPMLPDRLSGDLCSLHEGVERACIAVRMRITEAGDLLDAALRARDDAVGGLASLRGGASGH